MADTIRRVVTTHDKSGEATLLADDRLTLPAFPGGKAKGAVVWTTGEVPADNFNDLLGDRRPAGMSLKGGSVLRVTEFGPGFVSPMHRTLSIDYAVVLSGELEIILDGGETVRLRPGDAVVQRGANHAWRNPRRDCPCRIMVVMIEAHPVAVAGNRLGATPTWRMVASALATALVGTSKMSTASPAASEILAPGSEGIRRIVTGHNSAGKAVILSKQIVDLRRTSVGLSEAALWSTAQAPADNGGRSGEPASPKKGRSQSRGSTFCIVELEPGCDMPARQTFTIDYGVVLSGRVELHLDGRAAITLSDGDALVVRGTRQAWRNPDPHTPCRIAVCTIEALPIAVVAEAAAGAE